MQEQDLRSMERALSGVSSELAATLAWDEVRPRVLRGLRWPYYHLALFAVALMALLTFDLFQGGDFHWSGLLLLVFLPDQLQRVGERRKALASASQGDLLQLYVKDLEKRRTRYLLRLLIDPVLALGCLTLALIGVAPAIALGAAGFLVLRLPFTLLVQFRRAGRELEELNAKDAPDPPGEDDEGEQDSWLEIISELVPAFLRVFLQWLGIPLGVVAAIRAYRVEESVLPAALALVLIVGSISCWIMAPATDEDDE